MPELLAKTADGKTCVLKVEDGEVTLSHEQGIISKSLVKDAEFKLSQTTEARVETGVKPYTSSAKLTIRYMDGGDEAELSVYSRREEKAEELRALVEADTRRRREALEKVMREHGETREAELNRLQLDLELAEGLFRLVEGLHGGVDWVRVGETLDQVERVEAEREGLSSSSVVRLGLEGLRNLLAKRHPLELKVEAADSLETLYQGVQESSRHSPRWFDRRISYLLLSALYRAWDIQLGSVVDGAPWGFDEGLTQVLDEVDEALRREADGERARPSGFESVRHFIYESVEQLLGVELEADITTVDDL